MDLVLPKDILNETFRASPGFTLRLFDRLPPEQQELLKDLRRDPEFYGILCPREQAGTGWRSVCQNTALLYYTLQEPGRLPDYVLTRLGEQSRTVIARLVLDGILEIEQNGTFVSGAAAHDLICEAPSPSGALGPTARLSIDALRAAQALETDDATHVSMRLYLYNRIPLSPHWQRAFPSFTAIADYLGIQPGGRNRPLIDRHWSPVSLEPPYDGWAMWQSHRALAARRASEPTYKLYVSPTLSSLPDAFAATVEVLAAVQGTCFKIGRDIGGLLRPDKMVAYFWSMDELAEAGAQLQRCLGGMSAHGVPFTAPMDSSGLLSWGIDPPETARLIEWQQPESWRLWLTNQLAAALLLGKAAASSTLEPWQFALDRIRLEGIETNSWTPASGLWQEAPWKEGA